MEFLEKTGAVILMSFWIIWFSIFPPKSGYKILQYKSHYLGKEITTSSPLVEIEYSNVAVRNKCKSMYCGFRRNKAILPIEVYKARSLSLGKSNQNFPLMKIKILPSSSKFTVVNSFTRKDNAYFPFSQHYLILKSEDGTESEIWEGLFDEIQKKSSGYESFLNLINSDIAKIQQSKLQKYVCNMDDRTRLISLLYSLHLMPGMTIGEEEQFSNQECTSITFTKVNEYLLYRFFSRELGVDGDTYDKVGDECILRDYSDETVKTICKS